MPLAQGTVERFVQSLDVSQTKFFNDKPQRIAELKVFLSKKLSKVETNTTNEPLPDHFYYCDASSIANHKDSVGTTFQLGRFSGSAGHVPREPGAMCIILGSGRHSTVDFSMLVTSETKSNNTGFNQSVTLNKDTIRALFKSEEAVWQVDNHPVDIHRSDLTDILAVFTLTGSEKTEWLPGDSGSVISFGRPDDRWRYMGYVAIARLRADPRMALAISMPHMPVMNYVALWTDFDTHFGPSLSFDQSWSFVEHNFLSVLLYFDNYVRAREEYQDQDWELIAGETNWFADDVSVFTNAVPAVKPWLDRFFDTETDSTIKSEIDQYLDKECITDTDVSKLRMRLKGLKTGAVTYPAAYAEQKQAQFERKHFHRSTRRIDNWPEKSFSDLQMVPYDQFIISRLPPRNDKAGHLAATLRKALLFAMCLDGSGGVSEDACWFCPYIDQDLYELMYKVQEANVNPGTFSGPIGAILLDTPQAKSDLTVAAFDESALYRHSTLVVGHHPTFCELNMLAYWGRRERRPKKTKDVQGESQQSDVTVTVDDELDVLLKNLEAARGNCKKVEEETGTTMPKAIKAESAARKAFERCTKCLQNIMNIMQRTDNMAKIAKAQLELAQATHAKEEATAKRSKLSEATAVQIAAAKAYKDKSADANRRMAHRCFRPSHLHRISSAANSLCVYLQCIEPSLGAKFVSVTVTTSDAVPADMFRSSAPESAPA
ncbi:hypothetical protein HDU87_001129 [Geranomyces variabilis]|uniref:Uncharacterized protein n=1 Tax=Geranomyces variabilis TaxID=109894 RepID=A0AAD5XU36_9FUNG|nr:hypothetical protein HDU87_001129 [Geranomyces variabilis]